MRIITPRESRKYDVVLLGATGYTGSLTAEHIARHLPTNLRWAIAGRSAGKLGALAARLRGLDGDRVQPDIEIVSIHDEKALHELIGNARVCISVVSYYAVGALVVEACVGMRTDYVDTEGDAPMQRGWFDRFHARALENGVVLIHSCGMFTAPHDILAWAAVKELADKYSTETKEVIVAVDELPQEVSGGTIETLGSGFELEPQEVQQAKTDAWYLSTKRGTDQISSATNALGIRHDPYLGVLAASSIFAPQNRAIVHRTWGLLNGIVPGYGNEFQYNEYDRVASVVQGWGKVVMSWIMGRALGSRGLYRILRMFSPKPGDGPELEQSRLLRVRMEVLAVGEGDGEYRGKCVSVGFEYRGGPYIATALFLAEAAASLLYERKIEGGLVGGCLTPAMLGRDLLDRVEKAGAKVEIGTV